MSINVNDIKLTLPEGLEQVGKPIVTGKDTAEVTIKATQEVSDVKISASYKDEAPVETEEITNVPVVEFTNMEFTGKEFVGETITVTSTFDKAPYIDLYSVTLEGEGLTQVEAPSISGNTIVSKYKLPAQQGVVCKVKADYNGKTQKEIEITTKVHDQIFMSITAEPASATVNQDVTLTCTFKKDVTDEDKPRLYKVADGAELKTDWTKSGKTFVIVYTVKTAGANVFSAVAHEGHVNEVSRSVTVNVSGAQKAKLK